MGFPVRMTRALLPSYLPAEMQLGGGCADGKGSVAEQDADRQTGRTGQTQADMEIGAKQTTVRQRGTAILLRILEDEASRR
jgi:hypothetical protein